MSTSIEKAEKSFVCGSVDLDTKQYYLVKQHTDGTIILAAAATDKIVGVLQNKPKIGEPALVRWGGTSKVKLGGTVTVGAWLTATTDGTAIATTTDKDVVIGKLLAGASGASGDILEVQLHHFTLSA